MMAALFFAYRQAEALRLRLRPVLTAWERWELDAASQMVQREIDPITGRPVAPCRELGECMPDNQERLGVRPTPLKTSTSTPTTVASAAPESNPNKVMAAATASSKKLLAPISAEGHATSCGFPGLAVQPVGQARIEEDLDQDRDRRGEWAATASPGSVITRRIEKQMTNARRLTRLS
jgi:hypothetical protein